MDDSCAIGEGAVGEIVGGCDEIVNVITEEAVVEGGNIVVVTSVGESDTCVVATHLFIAYVILICFGICRITDFFDFVTGEEGGASVVRTRYNCPHFGIG